MKKRSIRYKFVFCLVLLLILVSALSGVGFSALSLYRGVVKDLGWRAGILPVSTEISMQIEELRSSFREIQFIHQLRERPGIGSYFIEEMDLIKRKSEFDSRLSALENTLELYIQLLKKRIDPKNTGGSFQQEWATLNDIKVQLSGLKIRTEFPDWCTQRIYIDDVEEDIRKFRVLAGQLPNYQLSGLALYSNSVKNRYRTLFTLALFSGITSTLIFGIIIHLGYAWVFRPLSILIEGSRKIASGQFQHRIELHTEDEMSELADAMNDMTERFEGVCSDLDQQIRVRSQEAIRNERLASVGFLAAGIAHEINNPLASIAMCAESLVRRVEPFLVHAEEESRKTASREESGIEVVRKYLKMIQSEAFRCKTITEKLLDFSRTEKSTRERTNLTNLIFGMVEMIAHHGDYREKEVRLNLPEAVYATVNPQEMKQVVLNLLTNALDSISPGGMVRVKLTEKDGFARIEVEDDGCGMETEVLNNVFEPFYTRRIQGKGTGLGLSITHRIVSDHKGRIEASSAGIGKGSTFRVELPVN